MHISFQQSKIDIRKVLIFLIHNIFLVNILLSNIEQKLFNINPFFFWYQAKGAGSLNKWPRMVQSIGTIFNKVSHLVQELKANKYKNTFH